MDATPTNPNKRGFINLYEIAIPDEETQRKNIKKFLKTREKLYDLDVRLGQVGHREANMRLRRNILNDKANDAGRISVVYGVNLSTNHDFIQFSSLARASSYVDQLVSRGVDEKDVKIVMQSANHIGNDIVDPDTQPDKYGYMCNVDYQVQQYLCIKKCRADIEKIKAEEEDDDDDDEDEDDDPSSGKELLEKLK